MYRVRRDQIQVFRGGMSYRRIGCGVDIGRGMGNSLTCLAAPHTCAHFHLPGYADPIHSADSDTHADATAVRYSAITGDAGANPAAHKYARGAAAHGYSHCDRVVADIDSYSPANRYPHCDRAANESSSAPATNGYPSSSSSAAGTHLRTTLAILARSPLY